ncbi:MAG: class I SAM-dependent methyltransferase, partial [Clostridiales bacterium]
MDRKCPDFPDKEHYVGRVFADIAPVYDKANLLMSLGFLKNWQKFLINKTAFKPGQKALDIGTGTGELAFLLAEKAEHRGEVVALDISPEMLA